jgi:hypothetical protein
MPGFQAAAAALFAAGLTSLHSCKYVMTIAISAQLKIKMIKTRKRKPKR